MHQIGVGVLGPVFRTYEPDGDRLVALKAFHLDLTPERSRTVAEALQAIARVSDSHPALVTPLSGGLSDDIPYLATEYVAAESLDVAIRHYAPAPVENALPLIVQLADGLDTAHAWGLTHGALHLRDVFVTPELARITGFGVVPALEQVGLRGPLRRPYTAPEQLSSGEWGPAADRFALAAIVYELLTGRRAAGTAEQLTERLVGVLGTRSATRLAPLFAAALAIEPTERPGSARLFVDQLADAVGWTGAEAVREAMTRLDGPETVDRADAENPAKRSVAGAVAQTEGATGMANRDRPDDTRKSELDWSERSLDRGESEELRQTEEYQPRPVGPPPGFERPSEPERDAPPVDRMDGIDTDDGLDYTLDQTLGQVQDAAAARAADEATDQTLDETVVIPSRVDGSQPDDRPSATESWDLDLSAALDPGDDGDRDVDAPPVSLFDDVAAPKPEAAAGHEAARQPLEGISIPPLGADANDDSGSYDGMDDEYQVVEPSRARAEGERLATEPPESLAAGAYGPIRLSDLADRLGDDPDDADEYDDDEGDRDDEVYAAPDRSSDHPDQDSDLQARDGDHPAPIQSRRGTATPNDLTEYDYEYDDDDDDDQADEPRDDEAAPVVAGWASSTRLPVVPLVLIVLAVVAGAFAIGFGWLSSDASENTAADASLTTGAEGPGPNTASVTPGDAAGREFSEATISDPPPPVVMPRPEATEPALDTSSTSPALVSSPVQPETPTPVEPDTPTSVAAVEAPSPAPPPAPPQTPTPSPTPAPAPAASDGRLLVRSTPPGAQVTVNGEPRGTTPLALSDLQYAAYDVRLTFEGYETEDRRLTISADDPIAAVQAQLAPVAVAGNAPLGVGSIFVDTRPPGVQVWLDQEFVGDTPMVIPNVATGSHNVEFKRDGYREWATTVQVGSETQARVTASLAPAP